MSRGASVIEINGNRYDAVTGQLIGAVKKVASQVKKPASGAIDGLIRKPAGQRSHLKHKLASPRQRTQNSQTLMRGGLKRPVLSNNTHSSGKTHQPHTAAVKPARALHAKTVIKDSRVKHFGQLQAVAASLRPSRAQAVRLPAKLTGGPARSGAPGVVGKPLPSMVASISHQHLERLLDKALREADSHKQALKAQVKGWRRIATAPKWLSIGVGSLVVLLLAGFFAWQNIPQVSMRVAAFRAHVDASVPAYTPSGFVAAGPASASADKVTINYESTANSQQGFAITQQASNWDSKSVQANAVSGNSLPQTEQVNGTTVYIYGASNNAKWVNHGVLFTLKDQANLSSDQIVKIANSL